MLGYIRVIRKSVSTVRVYDQITKLWNTDGFVTVFGGKARIQPYGIIGDQIVAQDTTGRRLMRVQIKEKLSGINLDDMIAIDASPENPELMGFTLEVRGTIGSTNSWLTDLVCEADLKRDITRDAAPGIFPATPDIIDDVSYEYTAIIPTSTWTIPIPAEFDRIPGVTVYDAFGVIFFPDVQVTNTQVIITFSQPTAGKALLN